MHPVTFSRLTSAPVPQNQDTGRQEKMPAALPALAKLVLILAVAALLTPLWLNLLSQLGSDQSWYALRLVALGGVGFIVTLSVLVIKLATGVLKTSPVRPDPHRGGMLEQAERAPT